MSKRNWYRSQKWGKGTRREHGVTAAWEELSNPDVHQEPDKAHSCWLSCVVLKEAAVSIAELRAPQPERAAPCECPVASKLVPSNPEGGLSRPSL